MNHNIITGTVTAANSNVSAAWGDNTYYPYGDPFPNSIPYTPYPNITPAPTTTIIHTGCGCGCCHTHSAEAFAISVLNDRIKELEARIKELETPQLDKPADS